jgi:hypothetical protein
VGPNDSNACQEETYALGAGLYIVTAGTDGKVVVWADEGKACVATRKCATPVVDAAWHPSANVLALQVATASGHGLVCNTNTPNMAMEAP